MHPPKPIRDNMQFLLVEVQAQLEHLQAYFEHEAKSVAQRVVERTGYAYNLSQRIQNGCLLQMQQQPNGDGMTLRAVAAIAVDLERLTELCRACVHQLGYLRKGHKLDLTPYPKWVAQVADSLSLVDDALWSSNTRQALKLGRIESKLDTAYQQLLAQYTRDLKRKKYTEDLVIGLFVARSIEQMGDVLLSISEAIISSTIGQPLDTQRFQSLSETLTSWADKSSLNDVQIKPIAETRSGSGISAVRYRDANNDEQLLIFKGGEKQKLKEELDGVQSWHEIYPGVAPQVLTYRKKGDSAALLVEHLQGLTFEQILLQAPKKTQRRAMKALRNTLHSVWRETRISKPASADFVAQTRKRMREVYAIHPSFKQQTGNLCGLPLASFEHLLSRAAKKEKQLSAPFSVFIHGDFNIDNIIYDPENGKINFIDLHRSTYTDYVQDVSVFMVSNYRLQVLDAPVRQRIRQQVLALYAIAREFAEAEGDDTFEARLALGLARSFATSTRFILDRSMARTMFLRARYLLQQVVAVRSKQLKSFRLPLEELFRG